MGILVNVLRDIELFSMSRVYKEDKGKYMRDNAYIINNIYLKECYRFKF